MFIIIVTSSRTASGGTRQALYLAAGLQDLGHEVRFVCPPDTETAAKAEGLKLCVSALPPTLAAAEKSLRALMPGDKPVIVHGFHNRGVKTVAYLGTLWRILGLQIACFANRGVTSRPHNPLPYLLPGIRGFIVNSKACGDLLPLFWRKKRCHLVSNSIPDWRLTPTQSADAVRAGLAIPEAHAVIGNICNDNPRKGAPAMLRAFALARRALGPSTLVMVGVEPQNWLPLCEELDIHEHVRLIPKIDNVADYLQIMSLLVFPSSFIESQPNVIMEGMSFGLPVIGSDIGGIKDLLPEACLFDPADTTAISDLMVALLNDPKKMQKLGGDNLAMRHLFSLERRLRIITGIYADGLEELRQGLFSRKR